MIGHKFNSVIYEILEKSYEKKGEMGEWLKPQVC